MPHPFHGSDAADTLLGGDAGDIIAGRAGNDLILGDGLDGPRPPVFPEPWPGPVIAGNVIRAGAGDDTVQAGYGRDLVHGGEGDDVIFGWGVLADGDAYRDAYARDGDLADSLYGSAGNDSLYGGGGHDLLDGGRGDDRLEGGVGADTLTGGAGADIFVFGATDARAKLPVFDTPGDVVTDFEAGTDRLDLSRFPGSATAEFLGDGTFTDALRLQVRSVVGADGTHLEIWVPTGGLPPGTVPDGPNASITLLGEQPLTIADFLFA